MVFLEDNLKDRNIQKTKQHFASPGGFVPYMAENLYGTKYRPISK